MKQHKILLVEDSVSLLKLGKAIFESGGFYVITATDGVEALKVLEHQAIALIVTDILMPNMDGYSLCYNIRNNEQTRHIPIIVYSATYTSSSDEELAKGTGANMFIRKPATMSFLVNAATELIAATSVAPLPDITVTPQLQGLSDVMRQYSSRLIEKLEHKNTQLEMAQAALKKNESRFRALVENNYEAITLRDAAGNLFYQSPGAERIIGYKIEDIGIQSGNLIHPYDLPNVMSRLETSLKNPGMPVYGVHRVRHKDGHYIWLEGTTTNLLNDENIYAIVGNFRDISDRKEAEEKIKTANRLYAFVSAINQTIVHVSDEQTLFNEACKIAVEIGGFELAIIGRRNEAEGTLELAAQNNATANDLVINTRLRYDPEGPIASVLSTGQRTFINDFIKEPESTWKKYVLQRGASSGIILPINKRKNTIGTFNLLSTKANFFDAQELALLEEVAGDISFALDVFEREKQRKEIEQRLIHSEQRLLQAQEIAHIGSWELDFASDKGVWSAETCRIYGLTADNNVHSYSEWLSFVHPDDVKDVLETSKKAEAAFTNFSFHHRIIRPDGAIRHLLSEASFDINDNGLPVGLYGVVHDVTETKTAQEALAQSEANLRQIMDLIPQAIFAKDFDGRYSFVNKSLASLYGLTPKELINKFISETIPVKSELGDFTTVDQRVIMSGKGEMIPELAFTDSEGNVRLFEATKVPYTEPGTNKTIVLGVANEITEQKKAEQERTKMIADIVQRNKDLEQFSYIISHNLRAPVANIIGLTEVVKLPGLADSDKEEIMTGISTSVARLDTVIMDLNHILQIRQSINEQKELVIFSTLVDDIKDSISNIIKAEGVSIRCSFGEINEMQTVKSYLHSIFFNLISNSIKYRRANVKPVIEITSKLLDEGISIIFKDNGLGMDINNKEHQLFGLYKRFHFHVDGKGIGLYMVKTQVESLGGTISVSSDIDKGTEFSITFRNKTEMRDEKRIA